MKIEIVMKRMHYSILLIIMAISSCKKEENGPPALQIVAVSPDSGAFSNLVTIVGKGFSPNTSDNKVQFNGKDAEVKQGSTEHLLVKVPKGAGGAVTVQLNGNTATGPVFNYVPMVTVSTFAGSGAQGFLNGTGTAAQFNYPRNLTADAQGNVYVSDAHNHAIRKITPNGVVSTYAGTGNSGYVNGKNDEAQFTFPAGVAVDNKGNVYVADEGNNSIRKITPSRVVSTLAGNKNTGFVDNTGTAAAFNHPVGVTVDPQGTLYVADRSNHSIRTITPAGLVKTLAGNGISGFANGKGAQARFFAPMDVTVDANGMIYVADGFNLRIRKITPAGEVTTIAGTGQQGFADGPANKAQFDIPYGIMNDAMGNLYIADAGNYRIRKVSPSGMVSTFAGRSTLDHLDGIVPNASFMDPMGIAIDAKGIIYVADGYNNRIRKIIIE